MSSSAGNFGWSTEDKLGRELLRLSHLGNEEKFFLFVEEHPNVDVNFMNLAGESALYFAARKNVAISKKLIEMGANIYARTGVSRATVFHSCAIAGNIPVLELLLQIANPDHLRNFMKTDLKAWDGCNPVHLAAKNGVLKVLNLLIDAGLSYDGKSWTGCTPLHYAVAFGRLEAVLCLLQKGVKINTKTYMFGASYSSPPQSPLHLLLTSICEDETEIFREVALEFVKRKAKIKGCKMCEKGDFCCDAARNRMSVIWEIVHTNELTSKNPRKKGFKTRPPVSSSTPTIPLMPNPVKLVSHSPTTPSPPSSASSEADSLSFCTLSPLGDADHVPIPVGGRVGNITSPTFIPRGPCYERSGSPPYFPIGTRTHTNDDDSKSGYTESPQVLTLSEVLRLEGNVSDGSDDETFSGLGEGQRSPGRDDGEEMGKGKEKEKGKGKKEDREEEEDEDDESPSAEQLAMVKKKKKRDTLKRLTKKKRPSVAAVVDV